MPGIINTTPTDLCKAIIGYVLARFLPPGTGAIKTKLTDFIFNICKEHIDSPKTYFENLSYEEQNFISQHVISLKKTFQKLTKEIKVLGYFKITIMDKKVADEWIKFFDNFKTHTY